MAIAVQAISTKFGIVLQFKLLDLGMEPQKCINILRIYSTCPCSPVVKAPWRHVQ